MLQEPEINCLSYLNEDTGPFCPDCGHEDLERSDECTTCIEENISNEKLSI